MGEDDSIVSSRYAYVHDCIWPSGAIDVHHVFRRNRLFKLNGLFLYLVGFVLVADVSYLVFVKDKSGITHFWSFLLCTLLIRYWCQKTVEKESVVILPAFGVQLETHYISGRVIRRFVPISNVLKPVLIECVTPVTCYWSLSLIIREEDELLLVFKEIRPPLKMLTPIWKALCAAIDNQESQQLHASNNNSYERIPP